MPKGVFTRSPELKQQLAERARALNNDPEIRRKQSLNRKGRKFSLETRMKMSEAHIGFKRTLKYRKNLSLSKLAEKNPNWIGDKVGYSGIHAWIKRRLKKSDLCQDCKKVPPHDLANISQEYKRELSDWEWLCRRCHMLKDGRMTRLHKSMMAMNKKTVKFTANKPIQRPTTVEFQTKDGKTVIFKATETVIKPTKVEFKAKRDKK